MDPSIHTNKTVFTDWVHNSMLFMSVSFLADLNTAVFSLPHQESSDMSPPNVWPQIIIFGLQFNRPTYPKVYKTEHLTCN